MKYLFNPVQQLLDLLREKNITVSEDSLQFFIALDEVSNLVDADSMEPTILNGFCRMIRLLRHHPFWTFILSTQRPLHYSAPLTSLDSSFVHIKTNVHRRVTAFYSFLTEPYFFDADVEKRALERTRPIADYSSVVHLARLGRPLWLLFTTGEPGFTGKEALEFVETKLFCEQTFDHTNKLLLLAMLSYRVAIDPCLNRAESTWLQEPLVGFHLRYITHIYTASGIIRSSTLEEPIVSAAAASALCSMTSDKDPWVDILRSMYSSLCSCSPGLIDKGYTGELFLRCVIIQARDTLFRANPLSDAIFNTTDPLHIRQTRPFRFVAFIEALLAPRQARMVLDSPADCDSVTGNLGCTVRKVLGKGYCNFTHWTSTSVELEEGTTKDIPHQLLYTQAALQFASNQEVWDEVIPIYCGNLDEQYDDSKVALLLIQVKNKCKGAPGFNVTHDKASYTKFFPGRKIISILFDFALKLPEAEVAKSFDKHVWGFRINGSHANLFHSMDKDLDSTMDCLLQNDTTLGGLQACVSEYNAVANHHSWDSRWNTDSIPKVLDHKGKRPIEILPSENDERDSGEDRGDDREWTVSMGKKKVYFLQYTGEFKLTKR